MKNKSKVGIVESIKGYFITIEDEFVNDRMAITKEELIEIVRLGKGLIEKK